MKYRRKRRNTKRICRHGRYSRRRLVIIFPLQMKVRCTLGFAKLMSTKTNFTFTPICGTHFGGGLFSRWVVQRTSNPFLQNCLLYAYVEDGWQQTYRNQRNVIHCHIILELSTSFLHHFRCFPPYVVWKRIHGYPTWIWGFWMAKFFQMPGSAPTWTIIHHGEELKLSLETHLERGANKKAFIDRWRYLVNLKLSTL